MSALSIRQQMQKSQASYDILLIEDDEATSEMLTECIESESSFRVKSLSSAEDALQHLQTCAEASRHANLAQPSEVSASCPA